MTQKNKYLIIQTAFIGDVILATSLVKKIRDTDPLAQIDFLLRAGNENLLTENKNINRIFVWNKKEKLKSLIYNIKLLRQEKYNYAINIQRFFNSGLITALCGAKVKIGFDKNPLSFLFTHKVLHRIPYFENSIALHEVQRNEKLLTPLGFNLSLDKIRPQIFFSEAEINKVNSIINRSKKFIVMAPSSVWFTKALGKEKWIELIKNLIDFNIYCIGAPSDKDFINDLIKSQHHAFNLCGQLSLTESAYLMKLSEWVLVNDSAPLHLASSVNANTIAFFCSTIQDFGYTPLADKSYVIDVKNLECRPCGLHGKNECPLGHFNCSNQIDLNKVIQIIHS